MFHDRQLAGAVAVTLAGVRERDPSGVFTLLRFDDDKDLLEPEFKRHWGGFLHLMNRVQFLPNTHLLTVRGCRNGVFSGAVDAFTYFLAGGEPTAPTATPDEEFVHPGVRSLLAAIFKDHLPQPCIGFEWEVNDIIAAAAELAWEDRKLVVLAAEAASDRETFAREGWQVFLFHDAGLSDADVSAILNLLTHVP
jgi:DEAD/DEAH box helicase domain-containing protein